MSKTRYLTISDVVRLTGLTQRTLRFYEERGLVNPLRTDGGRRAYASTDLIRLHQVMLLRRARFSLSQIKALLDSKACKPSRLIDIQIESLESEQQTIHTSLATLYATRKQLSNRETVSPEALCELIRTGEQTMQEHAWQKIYDKYYTPEEQENWQAAKEKLAAEFDQQEYETKWRDLVTRIEKALPLDPHSDLAQSFLQEWKTLMQAFTKVADEEMLSGANRLWDNMDDWSDTVDSPISKTVWEFIVAAGACRKR